MDQADEQDQQLPSLGERSGLAKIMGDDVIGHERAAMQMIRQAAHNGWAVRPEWKEAVPAVMMRILVDPHATIR